MATLKRGFVLLASVASAVYTCYVVGKLMYFLSVPKRLGVVYDTLWIYNLLDNRSRLEQSIAPLITDYTLVVIFLLQHTLMKTALVKQLIGSLGLETAQRTIYTVTSSLSLHLLVRLWLPTQSVILWKVDLESSTVLWWVFAAVHALAWLMLYGSWIVMDLPDILGVKQAYYDYQGWSPPLMYKSSELKALYQNVRHPSIILFSIIFWVTNIMTLDRFVLALLLTSYMYVFWSTDKANFFYQKKQWTRKMLELKKL